MDSERAEAITRREDKPKDVTIEAGVASMRVTASDIADVWVTASFAREWFEDALHEAKTGSDHKAIRREIVFAVSVAESYLSEWVRDQILDRSDYQKLVTDLNQYFPPEHPKSVTVKWNNVPKTLRQDGLIPATPNLNQLYWREFRKLVGWRNGLVHARSSRPETAQQADKEKPLRSTGDLDKLPAGWATEVVVALVKELHKAVGTPAPDWLVIPT